MEEIGDKIWQHVAETEGPHVAILGGVHGNEETGVMLVDELVKRFTGNKSEIVSGTLTIALGNPRAVKRGTRGSKDHRDMNRCFTDAALQTSDTFECRRAQEIAAVLDTVDVLADMHATNKPSVPFLAMTHCTPAHQPLINLFDCDRMLIVSPNAIDGTTDGYVNKRGKGIGVIFESGLASDTSVLKNVREVTERILWQWGVVSGQPDIFHPTEKQKYGLQEAVILTDDGFRFASGRGLGSFEAMNKGDIIGYHGSSPLHAPYDGVLMFPKVPELWKVGNPVVSFAETLT